jgi:ketosteroid isomerase-like protein
VNERERVATDTVSAINERDYSQIEKLSTEDVQLRLPPSQVFTGRTGIEQFFHELERMLPELTLIAREIHSGEEFAVVEWDSAGTSANQSHMESMGALVLRFKGDRIQKATLYVDTAQWQKLRAATAG